MNSDQQSRNELRQTLRKKRNQLSKSEQTEASIALANQLISMTKAGDKLAIYLANDGELSPNLAIEQLQQNGRHTYLPVMHPFRKGYLNFQQAEPFDQMQANNFGILEPKLNSQTTLAIQDFDCIFMPLVGFDKNGNRLGMGGGFYDRTLNKIHQSERRPTLVGLAHDCQQVEKLPIEPWDVPIDLIVTPTQKIQPK